MSNIDIDLIDFLELINVTLSEDFIERWRYKYSLVFIKQFQFKLLESLKNQKPLKLDSLYLYLTKKCSYSREQVLDFFDTIDIDLYRPMIQGKLTKP